jgi:ATP-dependent protease ClpP protease subunit
MTREISRETRRKLSAAGRRGAAARMAAKRPQATKDAKPGAFRTARPMARIIKGQADWYEIKAVGNDTTEVYIYDEIGYWGVTATSFVNELRQVRTANIDLHLNSPGGDVFDGLAIYNALISHPANVDVYIDGLAASAASYIALAGDTVKIARNAMVMVHDAMGFCIGWASDMHEMGDLLDKISDDIADIYAQKTGAEKADWRAAMLAETWFSGEEAVEAGLADETFNDRGADTDDPEDTFDLSVFNYAGRSAAPAPTIAVKNEVVEDDPEETENDDPGDPGETTEGDDVDYDALAASLRGAFA